MLLSAEQLFSEEQALSGAGADASTNIIDLGATGTVINAPTALVRDIGKGEPIVILVTLTADSGGTNPKLDVDLEVDDNDSFSSATTVASSQQMSDGSEGDRVTLYWVPEGTNERYMRLNYTLGGTSPTYEVTAGIVGADQTNKVPGA